MRIDDPPGGAAARLSGPKRRLLERYLDGRAPAVAAADDSIPRRPVGAAVPISIFQEPIWLHGSLAPGLPLYNEALTIRRTGPLDVAALEWSLGEVLRRHEAWRTTLALRDGAPVQIVRPAPRVFLPVHDLRRLPAAAREREALRLLTEEARRPFDLLRGPLVRHRLVRVGEWEHRLDLTLHQMVFDGVSAFSVFLPELVALYEARLRGRPSPLREDGIQYGDFALWQRLRLRDGASRRDLDYWDRALAGAPVVLDLPVDRPRPASQTFRGAQMSFILPKVLGERIRDLSRREGTTLFMTLLAALNVLLHQHTGQEDMLVGTAAARRDRPELEGVMGLFLNTLVIRTRLSEDDTFRKVLTGVRDATLEALAHGDVPIGEIVARRKPARDSSRNPLFQVMLVLEPPLPPPPPGWDLAQMEVDTGTARVDLHLQLDDRPDGIRGRVRYSADLFEAGTIARMVDRFRVLLEGIAADPGGRVASLPILAPADRGGSLRSAPCPTFTREQIEQSIVQRFAWQAKEHPCSIAVSDGQRRWTYAALDDAAVKVAGSVAPEAGGEGARIALLLDHDGAMVASVLGVLMAGAAYVPLDPGHPSPRLAGIVEDCDPRAVLACARHRDLARTLAGSRKVLILEEMLDRSPGRWRRPPPAPDAPAYILYTSGSTGRPKGVVQSHRNVLHFIQAYSANLRLRGNDRLTLLSSYSVDAAVMDVFGALLNAATLCPIDIRDVGLEGLRDRLRREGVTVYHSTPTVFRHLIGASDGRPLPRRLRLVVLGGEEVRREDVEAYRRHTGRRCLFVNGLGPTESTVTLQHFIDRETPCERPTVPVGRPVADTEVLLLSPRGRPGQVYGEIAVRSRHIALGYWRNPLLTGAAFLPDPDGGSRRIYRTGDMGRLLADGSIEFAGRKDLQVKIRGFRVEPVEIEEALSRHPGVLEAAVVVHDHSPGEKRLVAFWVAATEPPPEDDVLRRHLRERLPDSMIPSAFVRLEALPLTTSGKVDRRALPDPREAPTERGRAVVPPRDAIEARLAGLFEEVLGTAPVGLDDPFFDLGGHSLLALRLVAGIEAHFGIRIPPATLFTAPTVARLADVLRGRGRAAQWSSLVPLRSAGDRPPFFAVHGHSGEVLFYRDLCRRLGSDLPFYGLQSRQGGGRPPRLAVGPMAADYLDEMSTVQRHGPYRIGGYCLGAIVAFEMARQLLARGEEVALLALFVGHDPLLRLPFGRLRRRMTLGLERARSLRGPDRAGYLLRKGGAAARFLARGARAGVLRIGYRLLETFPGLPLSPPGDLEDLNLHAARAYRPRPFPGRMTVFLSGQARPGLPFDPKRDLDGLEAREIEVVRVPGVTDTMMNEPHVAVLAGLLKARLDDLDTQSPGDRARVLER